MKNSKNQEGFTLIEVIIALGVFSIGILAMLAMHTTGIKGNATARTITTAAIYATDRLEQIYAMDYNDPNLSDNTGDGAAGLDDETVADADGNATGISPEGSYSIFWNVWEDAPMPMTKTVRVIIHSSAGGNTKTVVFNYIKAENVDT